MEWGVLLEFNDLELEASPRSLELREDCLREVGLEPWLLSVRAGGMGEETSATVTPAETSTVVGLSMYFSISLSLFHLLCRSSKLAVFVYFEVEKSLEQTRDTRALLHWQIIYHRYGRYLVASAFQLQSGLEIHIRPHKTWVSLLMLLYNPHYPSPYPLPNRLFLTKKGVLNAWDDKKEDLTFCLSAVEHLLIVIVVTILVWELVIWRHSGADWI